jgi:hypothetical protein
MTSDDNADYYTCTNEVCPAYQKTFRDDEALHYGCEHCRSEHPEEFPALRKRTNYENLKTTDSVSHVVTRGAI